MKAYAIANLERDADPEPLLDRIEILSRLRIDVIQLRAKHLDDRDLLELALRARRRIAREVVYLINGRADIAVVAGADGVHLPADGIPVPTVRDISSRLIVGVSCHDPAEVEEARRAGADLAVIGPAFDARSTSKKAGISLDGLRTAAESGLPVYALGGMTIDRLPLLEGIPLAGVAAVTMFMKDEPVDQIIAAVREAGS